MKTLITTALLMMMTSALGAQDEPRLLEFTRTGESKSEYDRFTETTQKVTRLLKPKITDKELKKEFPEITEEGKKLQKEQHEKHARRYYDKGLDAMLGANAYRVTTPAGEATSLVVWVRAVEGSPEEDVAESASSILVDGKPTVVPMSRATLKFGGRQATSFGPLPRAKKSIEVRVAGVEFKITGDALKALQPKGKQ